MLQAKNKSVLRVCAAYKVKTHAAGFREKCMHEWNVLLEVSAAAWRLPLPGCLPLYPEVK